MSFLLTRIPCLRPSLPVHALRRCWLVLLFTLALPLHAANVQDASHQGTSHGRSAIENGRPTDRKVPLLSRALRLSDFEGMKPSPDLGEHLLKLTGFVQRQPHDGQPASEDTVAYLGYTSTDLYVAFVCFDHDPEAVRTHLARREDIFNDDSVMVLLDPFQDHRRGVIFRVNPDGVQADAAFTEGSGTDYSYDQVWDSYARRTSKGWIALMVIPFKSIRFRPGAPGWGVVLGRKIPRNSEWSYWPRITNAISGTLTQEGTLVGIDGVTGSHNIQFNPYVLGQNERTLETVDPSNPSWSNRKAEGAAGGELKAVLNDQIVLDATINPDFSDIESDSPQFTVNQRYSVYFPELRPFFLENANYFSTPIGLVYTRNIVRPEAGVRLTGKSGDTNFGMLVADDRSYGQALPQRDPNFQKKALFGVGRVSQDIGKGSSIGGIYTDYEFANSFNRIGGVDFTAQLNDHWIARGQMVESATQELDGTYAAGPASRLSISRTGHSFNLWNNFKDYSTGFQSQVGFINQTDIRSEHIHSSYTWYPNVGALQSTGLQGDTFLAWDHQGNRIGHYSTVDGFVQLSRSTSFIPLAGQNSDTVGPQDGYNVPANENFTENFAGLIFRSAPTEQLNFSLQFNQSGNVNYNPAKGGVPTLLNQQTAEAYITVQPLRMFSIDNTYLLDRDFEAHGGDFAYESQTFRTKLNYQFTQALSARVIVEYDNVLANPLESSLLRTKEVSTEALLTWLPHPGTAVYIGYNNDLQNYDRTLCSHVSTGNCNPADPILTRSNNYLNDGRQIFIKASYLFRF